MKKINKGQSKKEVFMYILLIEIINFAKSIIFPLISTLVISLLIFIMKNNVNVGLDFFLFIGVSILIILSTTYILDRQTLLITKEFS